jgi:hypothetical protein
MSLKPFCFSAPCIGYVLIARQYTVILRPGIPPFNQLTLQKIGVRIALKAKKLMQSNVYNSYKLTYLHSN